MRYSIRKNKNMKEYFKWVIDQLGNYYSDETIKTFKSHNLRSLEGVYLDASDQVEVIYLMSEDEEEIPVVKLIGNAKYLSRLDLQTVQDAIRRLIADLEIYDDAVAINNGDFPMDAVLYDDED